LARINATNEELHASVDICAAGARAAAKESDARYAAGNPRALEGLPIVVKVNIETKGDICSASTHALKDWRPKQDADCVAKLRAAGAIILSKTNMPEMAFGFTGWSALHGMCKNPHESSRTNIGGSSSGTAASVAAGICSVGLGTDTMGSLRLPSEASGINGFKPSLKKWSVNGVVPCILHKDTPGPMGATVSDLCLLDSVV
jgi:Asp-tRNA(Asn)/Glu-tRNA(Gln) amidotransferase A subunit family amidase